MIRNALNDASATNRMLPPKSAATIIIDRGGWLARVSVT